MINIQLITDKLMDDKQMDRWWKV